MQKKEKTNQKQETQMSLQFSETTNCDLKEEVICNTKLSRVVSIERVIRRKERSELIKQVERSGIFG